MARISFGPIVSSISGSVGSACFRRSPSGAVLYNKPRPSSAASPAQLEHRAIFSAAARAWSALDADILTAWDSLAAQTQVPSYFSRGRRWRGKDLFTCFFVYAQHQNTPLPARWLPTPPLFFMSPCISWLAYAEDISDPSHTWIYFSAMNPVSLNPSDPEGYRAQICNSFWFGYTAPGATVRPRRFIKIAPPPPSLYSLFNSHPLNYAGYQYEGWDPVLSRLLGTPPGLPSPTLTPKSAEFGTAACRFSVTDDRLYYSPITFGNPHHDFFGQFPGVDLVSNALPANPLRILNPTYPLDIPTSEY